MLSLSDLMNNNIVNYKFICVNPLPESIDSSQFEICYGMNG